MGATELVLGLGGIAGTLIGSMSANRAAARRERAEHRRQDGLKQQHLLRAIRLVRSDLDRAASMFRGSIKHERWWPESDSITEGYLYNYREQLGGELTDHRAWAALQAATMSIDRVTSTMIELSRDQFSGPPPWGGPVPDLLTIAAEACEKASSVLIEVEAPLVR